MQNSNYLLISLKGGVTMKGKQVIVVICIAIFTAVITVVASSSSFSTPLYTIRMEQASSKMNFLPKEANQFIYTAINGHKIFYDIKSNGIFDDPPESQYDTCVMTECDYTCGLDCQTIEECPTGDPETCEGTSCTPTCESTCDDPTCEFTSDIGWHGLPSDYCLISETSGPPWLYFGGNWGYRVRREKDDCSIRWFDAPRGPLYCRETWLNPVGWAFSKANNRSEILRKPYTLFSLSCPADMVITNSIGQRLGFVNGEFVQEIPNSYIQNLGEKEAYLITGIDKYTVEVFGTGKGIFNLACSVNSWNNTKTIKYSNVPVTATTKAVLDLGSDLLHVDANKMVLLILPHLQYPSSYQVLNRLIH